MPTPEHNIQDAVLSLIYKQEKAHQPSEKVHSSRYVIQYFLVNKDTRTAGGTARFSLKPAAVLSATT